MKILVVGANGQVGRELSSSLNFLTLQDGRKPQFIFSSRSELDLEDLPAISRYLDLLVPDIIVNAAAYTAVDEAEFDSERAFLVNEGAVSELAFFCKRRKSFLIHISTDYVFDGYSDRPYVETDEVGPTCVYGRSKVAGERIIREILDEHIILRTSWIFGAHGNNFVKTMLRLGIHKSELSCVCDQYGAPTSARGIASIITSIIQRLALEPVHKDLWGTYHYSGYPFVSWAAFAKEIFEQATYRKMIPVSPKVNLIGTTEYPTPAARPANSRLDCSKLKNIFDIEPDDWRRSLGLVLDELKEGMHS